MGEVLGCRKHAEDPVERPQGVPRSGMDACARVERNIDVKVGCAHHFCCVFGIDLSFPFLDFGFDPMPLCMLGTPLTVSFDYAKCLRECRGCTVLHASSKNVHRLACKLEEDIHRFACEL